MGKFLKIYNLFISLIITYLERGSNGNSDISYIMK